MIDSDDFTGEIIWLRPEALGPEYRTDEHLLVEAVGGSGCVRGCGGSSVFVQHLDGTQSGTRLGGVNRIATVEEREFFKANAKPYVG